MPPHISIRDRIKMGEVVAAVEESKGGVKAERAIGFELFLCKHLVERSLMRTLLARKHSRLTISVGD
jgi:hypothetical protein